MMTNAAEPEEEESNESLFWMRDSLVLCSFQDIIKMNVYNGETISRTNSEGSQWNTKVIALPQRRLASSNKNIKIWDIMDDGSLRLSKEMKGHTRFVFDLLYLGSNFICSASLDKTLRIWNTLDGLCIKMIRGSHVFGKLDILSIDRCLFVSACNDGYTKIWNWISGKCVKSFNNRKPVFSIICMSEKCIVAGLHGDPCEIKVWDVPSGTCRKTLRHGKGRLYSLEKIDDHRFVSGCEDSTIKLWNIKPRRRRRNNNNMQVEEEEEEEEEGDGDPCIRTFEGHSAMILFLSRYFCGRMFFSCQTGFQSCDGIKLWSSTTGDCMNTYEYLSKGFVSMESSLQIKERKERNVQIMERVQDGSIDSELVVIRFSDDLKRSRRSNKRKRRNNLNQEEDEGEEDDDDDENCWKIPLCLLGVKRGLMDDRNGIIIDLFSRKKNLVGGMALLEDEDEEDEEDESVSKLIDKEKIMNPYLLNVDEESLKIDRDQLLEVVMDCLFGEDYIKDESMFFDLYELFDSLDLQNHAMVILHKICDMRTNDLLFVFLKSLLKYEREKINHRDFCPREQDYLVEDLGFRRLVGGGGFSGSSTSALNTNNLSSDPSSPMLPFIGGFGSQNSFNISNLLSSNTTYRKERDEEVDDDVNNNNNNASMVPPPLQVHNIVDNTMNNNNNRTTTTNNPAFRRATNGRRSRSPPDSSSSSSSMNNGFETKYGLPFKKTAFESPFSYVCFRELKKRKIEISRNPNYLKHLEQVGILKNIFFFREDMMASLSSQNTFIANVIKYFLEKRKRMGSSRRMRRRRLEEEDEEEGLLLLQKKNLSFEMLFKLRVKHLFETKEFTNLKLLTKDGGVFDVHKEILMTRSCFFSQMFCFDGIESQVKEVNIINLTKDQLQVYLNWIYLGRLERTSEIQFLKKPRAKQPHVIMIDEDDDDDDDKNNNNNNNNGGEDETQMKAITDDDSNKSKESKVLPLLELYVHSEMYYEKELKFILRCELIDLLNQFGTPNSIDLSSTKKTKSSAIHNKNHHFSYIRDEEEEENTEIEQLLLRVGHVFTDLPDSGEDILENTNWVKERKIGNYRSIRTLIRCSSKVQKAAEKMDEMDQKNKNLEMKITQLEKTYESERFINSNNNNSRERNRKRYRDEKKEDGKSPEKRKSQKEQGSGKVEKMIQTTTSDIISGRNELPMFNQQQVVDEEEDIDDLDLGNDNIMNPNRRRDDTHHHHHQQQQQQQVYIGDEFEDFLFSAREMTTREIDGVIMMTDEDEEGPLSANIGDSSNGFEMNNMMMMSRKQQQQQPFDNMDQNYVFGNENDNNYNNSFNIHKMFGRDMIDGEIPHHHHQQQQQQQQEKEVEEEEEEENPIKRRKIM